MTREKIRQKQIEEAVSTSITETLMSAPNYEFSPRVTYLLECAFRKGAEWADENPASPWHKVADEDLPKRDGRYIVMAQNGYCHTCQYHTDDRYWDTIGYQSDIKYWMEIPELPTEQKGEQ